MSHVLAYDGQFFRVDITEVANPDDPENAMYVSWCSDAFKELKDMPSHALSRFIAGPPLPEYAERTSPRLRLDKNQLGCSEDQAGNSGTRHRGGRIHSLAFQRREFVGF